MKSVYSRSLLAMILATSVILVTSTEVGAFVPSPAAEQADRALQVQAPIRGQSGSAAMEIALRVANLEEWDKIEVRDENEHRGRVLRKEMGMADGVFPKTETQLLAQLDERNGKQDEGSKACVDCPEIVSIPGKKFAIGKYAVTFKEWDACVTAGGCGAYLPSDNGWGRGNRPVINVSWDDAQAYIKWLSEKTGKTYRLPTEEEWKIAALAGSTTEYYWGNDVGRNNANCDGCGSEWDNRRTAPVGSFKPNAFGLYDMMGNVWQWTDTCWQANCAKRLFFGGSWNHRPQDMRTSTRNWFNTDKRMRYLGFRLATTLP